MFESIKVAAREFSDAMAIRTAPSRRERNAAEQIVRVAATPPPVALPPSPYTMHARGDLPQQQPQPRPEQ